ncbi:MAG: hypothetical protein QM774_08180 [Gordonia sp. (in: high G+C Gram-positive bacteria)]|uniref:hypothetical protein n=1 Tax=Gordonia sp. (in: high G+C Gram-positive bacteria) TaxID=84139 RepID=UPI0039E21A78
MTDFGITPDRIASMAAAWRTGGDALRGLSFPAPPRPADCAAARAMAHCVEEAAAAATRLGTELTGLGDGVERFNTVTVGSDAAAAAGLVERRR